MGRPGRPAVAAAAAAAAARATAAAARLQSRQARRTICASAATAEAETFQYQAEVDRLMDLIVNSLYSNRDVFLRELVSNASDALDKIRLLAVQEVDEYKTGSELEIRIRADKEANTIVIEDTGVGLSREELISTLGTIAKSGTAKFMEAMKEKHDANLIGQFGVGFYSAFLVADKVTVSTKSNKDDKQWVWESAAGAHSYTIKEDTAADIPRGTRITLHLKPDATEFADATKLQGLIKQYSEFISFPIKLWVKTSKPEQVVDEEATAKAQEEADAKAKEEGKEEGAEKVAPVMKTEYREEAEWKVQNDNKPLWLRPAREVGKEEYDAFFKTTFRVVCVCVRARASPYAESLTRKGYEVLYLTEPVDEVAAQTLEEYEGHKLTDVSREDLQLDESEEDKKALEGASEELKGLTAYMKKVLGDKVEKVAVTSRLTDSPAVVVASKFGWSANMERIMRSQAMGDARSAEYMRGRRIMELNPQHPIIRTLKSKVELESREAKEQVQLLYEAALLAGGFMIESPKDFAARIYSMMEQGSGGEGAGSTPSSSVSAGGGKAKAKAKAPAEAEAEAVDPEVV
ncbi:hypothetical protein CHLNCDRAFT_140066 [Chlorella variabilis]|uniref:Histidine kinase/HSP90-like ATPase domain-containing protein n=1 Tax=Chlorella variabilis TaxID=554065 RepID=E1ZRI2_CHLVA|nr:hypothetical protein CHLNCDRAFT_140066 [Chlorella variabilis]EFN51632.1 hypothetical protein CHLNCDRAFT_140066 [Chlorella variabilis]|eukprot:XP_005843734.1 hypothetical protein CHLNCDRAFT_140066 [Chlorella variabilis]